MVKVVAVARLPSRATDSAAIHPVIARSQSQSQSESQNYMHSESPAKITRLTQFLPRLLQHVSFLPSHLSDLLAELIICLGCLRCFHYALTTDCQVYYCFRFAYELPKARRLLHGYTPTAASPPSQLPATIYQLSVPCAGCSVVSCRRTLQPKTSRQQLRMILRAAIHLFPLTAAVLDVSSKPCQTDMIIMRKNCTLIF